MPRVVNPPTKSQHGRRGSSRHDTTPHKSTTMKIPLNDDAGEKVARLQSRQALHDMQMNQIKAAVKTPMPPRRMNYEGASASPRTPRASMRGRESDVDALGRAVTPMKRVPILANFEEWMKMATDNKINATNSWNFALIDYFHDMSLLKEGDGVNFQKASCTLDGCVKIYTSRVDSVATETGKLLSGLAESNNTNKRRHQNEEAIDEDGEEEEEETGEDGVRRKTRKKVARSHEATLAPSFASIQLKKFELEFAVDPLFKKASADFDEGGAKGLLLNHLSIDSRGRIVFDSSDDVDDAAAAGEDREQTTEPEGSKSPTPRLQTANSMDEIVEIDLGPLANKFFPDLDILAEQDICPSLKNLDFGDESATLDIPFLRAPEDWRQDNPQPEQGLREASGIMLDDDIAIGFDDDDGTVSGFDIGEDAGFGEGGEAWAREAALEPMLQVHRVDAGDGDNNDTLGGVLDYTEDDPYKISLSHQPANRDHENILSYFDNALRKDWAGPEHWKIRRIKETAASNSNSAPRQRKEKEPFEINFSLPLDPAVAEMIYTQTSSNSVISLPKSQWKTKGRNLLPDDKHFNSRNLLRLFLKPKARMGFHARNRSRQNNNRPQNGFSSPNNGEIDEAFWATQKPGMDQANTDEGAGPTGTYDADFFADDDGLAFPHGLPMGGDDDDDTLPFADAREAFSPPMDPNAPQGASVGGTGGLSGISALLNSVTTPGTVLGGGFGSQLVTQGGRRVRPDYVAYARVAKKVDVRRLKEVMWKGMGDRLIASSSFSSASPSAAVTAAPSKPIPEPSTPAADLNPGSADQSSSQATSELNENLRFTDIMNGLKGSYPEQAMRDISTSYCFICLLHLANEKGLVLENKGGFEGNWDGRLEEIFVSKDAGAVIEGEV
ncbi:condensin complex component cnd2 [Coccidioides immitis RS]|uniref:Condensin complex subunit 2 n=1 Tax=Coccidioides immitis (strain RS) TaxID=246410 RepID=J3K3I2_COCIM|nr:condensin complex component cnd2 [Coccidioides immitis RS]EAS28748.3 condensin complex component cnd2 [Coccidioides immitis RS]